MGVPYSRGCGAAGGANLPLKPTVGSATIVFSVEDTGAPNDGEDGTPLLYAGVDMLGKPPSDIGDGGGALFAASSAFALKSLSPPANIIPDKVPVKKVAIGIIISKNF